MLTGKKANNGYTVSFSHIRNKKLQGANLQYKRVYWPEQQRYIRLRISTNALKTINKVGLEKMAERAGLDLMSLAYTDCLLYTSPSPRDRTRSRMPSSA